MNVLLASKDCTPNKATRWLFTICGPDAEQRQHGNATRKIIIPGITALVLGLRWLGNQTVGAIVGAI